MAKRASRTPKTAARQFKPEHGEVQTERHWPQMSRELAPIFAKFLSAGYPLPFAVIAIAPTLDWDEATQVGKRWMVDSAVAEALADVNGGKWEDLPPEKRLQLVLDKQAAEAAFHLWTHSFGEGITKEDIELMKQARDIVSRQLGQNTDPDDPIAAFSRLAMEMARQASAQTAARRKTPPQTTQVSAIPTMAAPEPKQKM